MQITDGPTKLAYSIQEVEKILGVSHQSVYNLLSEGKLKTFRIGGRRLVSRRALEDFIKTAELEARV